MALVRTRCRPRRMATIAFRVGVARPHTQFVWVDRSGHEIRRVGDSTAVAPHRQLPIWIKWPFFGAIQPEMPTSGSWKRGAGCSAASRLTRRGHISDAGPATAATSCFRRTGMQSGGSIGNPRLAAARSCCFGSGQEAAVASDSVARWALPFVSETQLRDRLGLVDTSPQ